MKSSRELIPLSTDDQEKIKSHHKWIIFFTKYRWYIFFGILALVLPLAYSGVMGMKDDLLVMVIFGVFILAAIGMLSFMFYKVNQYLEEKYQQYEKDIEGSKKVVFQGIVERKFRDDGGKIIVVDDEEFDLSQSNEQEEKIKKGDRVLIELLPYSRTLLSIKKVPHRN